MKEKSLKFFISKYWLKIDFTVIFIVAISMYIQNNTQFFVPFDRAALLLTNSTLIDQKYSDEESNLISGLKWSQLEEFDHPNEPVLLTIEQKTYDEYYGGIAPIDRCKIAGAIKPILAASPKLLFIDFDLSPLHFPTEAYRDCQEKLDKVLLENSDKLVLIEPFQNTDYANEWKEKLQSNGLHFATAKMNASLGLVLTSSTSANSVAHTVYNKINNCTEQLCEDEKIETSSPINYAGLGNFKEVDWKNSTLENKVVFFGGTFGIDDHHITPIGEETPGIMIQAYDYGTLLKPFSQGSLITLFAFLLEMMIAWIVTRVMKPLWEWYIQCENSRDKLKVEYSIFIYLLIFAVALVLAFGSLFLSGWLMRGELLGLQIWISPFPVVLILFLDGGIKILLERIKQKEDVLNTQENISVKINTIFYSYVRLMKLSKKEKFVVLIQALKIVIGLLILTLVFIN